MRIMIAENIRMMRKQRGMMQEQLAEALGVSIAAVSKWERGLAMPDISYIVEMADLFEISVDALLGYQVRSGACEMSEKRIHKLQKEKRYEVAAKEAEKALIRYPNDFQLVKRCAEMYKLFGFETGNMEAVERAIDLWKHAIVLMEKSRDADVNEYSIWAQIAQCYIVLGQKDKGIDLLKKYNVGGVHNSTIGLNYAIMENHEPEEALLFLGQAFGDSMSNLVNVMEGYFNYYVRVKDYYLAREACLWLINYLISLKKSKESAAYVDKIIAPYYAECAHLSELMGAMEDIEKYFRKANEFAKRYDKNPVYNGSGHLFWNKDEEGGIIYDDIGAVAMDGIEKLIVREEWSDNLKRIWKEIKEGTIANEVVE